MKYQVRVAGKVFEGNDARVLLKRAVEAKRAESLTRSSVLEFQSSISRYFRPNAILSQ